MAEKNRFSKPVAFNNKNEVDQKILKHVKKRNFSGYVKKLILEDIKAKERSKEDKLMAEDVITKPTEQNELPKLSAAEKLKQLKKAGNPAQLPNKNVD